MYLKFCSNFLLISISRPCRRCDINISCLDSCLLQEQLELRDETEHRRRCEKLQGCESKNARTYWSVHYGINRPSVLLSAPHFTITHCLLNDPQHDLEEGVLPLVMKLLINYFLASIPHFTLKILNDRIRFFAWTKAEKSDTPPDVESFHLQSALKLTAQKAKNFAMRLPALVGDLIPLNDPCWKNFLLIRQIYILISSPISSQRSLQYLEFLISAFLISFKDCYPLTNFTPKMHYLLHYRKMPNKCL